MPLRFEPDVSHADWLTRQDVDWVKLCSLGPPAFPAYARLFHPLEPGDDPADPHSLANVEGHLDDDILSVLTALLALHTETPDDCFFGLWEGFGEIGGGAAVGALGRRSLTDRLLRRGSSTHEGPPAFPPQVTSGPRVRIPNRDYLLFRGKLEMAGHWGAENLPVGRGRTINSPNLMWPADHSWFVATEIDLPWSGIGGSAALVEQLLAADGLDVEPVEPTPDVPYSRGGPGNAT